MIRKIKSIILDKVFKSVYRPGHYYSTIPDVNDILNRKENIFGNKSTEAIDLNLDKQLELLASFKEFENSIPYQTKENSQDLRYNYDNIFFVNGDANILYFMMRKFKPQRIIEVGSGFSSAIMMDTNDLFFDGKIKLDFIEPYPEERLLNLMKPTDNINIHKQIVQDTDIDLFKQLQRNDILFIDSSHVSKVGSDVNHLFFNILPILNPGVIIHVHDICFPFEYPIDWIVEGRHWNESYMLRTFLMYNNYFEILCFNNYLLSDQEQWLKNNLPVLLGNNGGSFWMIKK